MAKGRSLEKRRARALYRLETETDRNHPQGCWIWLGSLDPKGYGCLHFNKYPHAHVVAYRLYVGDIPEGKVLDHLCRNRACVNPAHLEPVTNAENILRGESPCAQNARKTHCKCGHEFTKENTRVMRNGSRRCITCEKIYYQAQRQKLKN